MAYSVWSTGFILCHKRSAICDFGVLEFIGSKERWLGIAHRHKEAG